MNKYRIANILAVLSIIGIVYSFVVFLYMQPQLTPAMPVVLPGIQALANWVLPAYLITGVYHIILLVNALRTFTIHKKNTFIHSFYVVVLILSGITLLSDVTLLSDIGKEYKLWDVSDQWLLVYEFLAVHFVVVLYGTFIRIKNRGKGQPLFEKIRAGNDILFIGINQIGFICALFGIAGVIASQVSGVTQPYQTGYMLLLSGLAIIPLASFAIYWAIKNRRKPLAVWFDEKQMSDSAIAALIALVIMLPLIIVFIVLTLTITALPASLWFSLLFFITLAVFTGTIMLRNKMNAFSEDAE